jgi:hypothetical protein
MGLEEEDSGFVVDTFTDFLLCCMIHYVVSDTYLTTSHLAS